MTLRKKRRRPSVPGPANGAGRFAIHLSEAVRRAMVRLHRRAWREGRGLEFIRALRQLIRELENRRFDIGEAAYRLPGLRMQVRSAVARPLLVDYAACEDRRLVFIKGVK